MSENDLKRLIPIKSRWRHYKGSIYVVVGYSRDESDLSLLVLYLPPDAPADAIPWSRPAWRWMEPIGYNREGKVLRYERMEEEEVRG